MSIDLIMQILQWLIPVGSAGTVIGCIFYRDLRKARERRMTFIRICMTTSPEH